MPYDFSDPAVRQSLAETDPDPSMQFDPRALFEMLRRRGRAKMLTNDLNNEVDRQGGLSFYNADQSGMVGHQTGNVNVDPLNDRDVQSLYDLEDASPFKMSGFRGSGPQELDRDPTFQLDMRGGYDAGPPPGQAYGNHYDPYHMQLEEPSPMAQHFARKQGY